MEAQRMECLIRDIRLDKRLHKKIQKNDPIKGPSLFIGACFPRLGCETQSVLKTRQVRTGEAGNK